MESADAECGVREGVRKGKGAQNAEMAGLRGRMFCAGILTVTAPDVSSLAAALPQRLAPTSGLPQPGTCAHRHRAAPRAARPGSARGGPL